MRISVAMIAASILLISSPVLCDVHLWGNLVINDTSVGAKFMGEIANETDEPVTNVKVTITAKDAAGEIIDEPYGYVDGYTNPENGLDTYIPPGRFVPFMFYGDVDAGDIHSYDFTISYEIADTPIPDIDAVTIVDNMHLVSGFFGITFFGEVTNNSSTCVYFTKVVLVSKNADGNIVDIDTGYVCGENYMAMDLFHTDDLVRPGDTAPFEVMTFVEPEDITSYYTIVNYSIGPDNSYEYFGTGNINIAGNVNVTDSLGDVKYLGEIENMTNRDIYFVSITFISRDASGNIIDIDDSYVNGTSYEILEGSTTDTHIAPGAKAPFEVNSSASFDDMASYEYIIHYQYGDEPVGVDSPAPLAFVLEQNYPNPFNPVTTISFTLSKTMPVKLYIYNIGGQMIEELVSENLSAGVHEVRWDASQYPSGVYFYVLSSAGHTIQRKMTLLK